MRIDKVAHLVLPRHPTLRPHARMLHHFRFLLPLLPRDQDGLSPLHYYDSVIQLVRHASREPTEAEFTLGLDAATQMKRMYVAPPLTQRLFYELTLCHRLEECRLEALEPSTVEFYTKRSKL